MEQRAASENRQGDIDSCRGDSTRTTMELWRIDERLRQATL